MQFNGQAEKDVYQYISQYIQIEQMSPLYSEIAEATGYSKKTINAKINSLLDKGYIERIYGSTRGITLP
tara:strand:- start:3856 stop:4062 length:207 start_codon:yes stop_codon:yes gene_type:complete